LLAEPSLRKVARTACAVGIVLPICLCPCSAAAQSPSGDAVAGQREACSLPGLVADLRRTPTADELLRAYNAQSTLVHSLRASLILHLQDDATTGGVQSRGSKRIPAMLSFKSPKSVRMRGMVPFAGRRAFDLASDGREFELLFPDGNAMRFLAGPVDAPANSSNPRENIRPSVILEAIRWLPARRRNSPISEPMKNNGGYNDRCGINDVHGEHRRRST
jgi:hypothetical protein